MAITSADPDNDPNTPRPSVSFGNASGGGSRSLRVEFPLDTGSSSLSEYYRGGGVVPASDTIGGETQSTYSPENLIESQYTIGSNLGSGTISEIDNSAPDYLFYARRVISADAPDALMAVPYTEDGNNWRVNFTPGAATARIRIYYGGVEVYTSSLMPTATAINTTEQSVLVSGSTINFVKGGVETGYSYTTNNNILISTPVSIGDLLFAWQYETTTDEDKFGFTFKVANGNVGQEYQHTDGYTYTTGADASGVPVIVVVKGEPVGMFNQQRPEDREFFYEAENDPRYNTWFDRYYIKRRTTANASNQQTVPLNNLVPLSGPISFSQLYGSRNFFEGSANIPGHSPAETSNSYIWEANNFPANITTDGTDVRSGALPGATAYRDGPVPSGFTTFNVPMGTFYIDPATFIGNIKLTLSPLDSATGDIRYYGGLDDDNGDAYVEINEVGIRIQNVDSGNDALVYKGEASPQFSGDGTNGDGRSITRFLSFNLQNVFTDVSETITETGRFVVYLTFGYRQPINYGDPDFTLNIDSVKVSWETA